MEIRLLTQSRKYFTYKLDIESEPINTDGIKYDGELLRFSTEVFDDRKACEVWFKENSNLFKEKSESGIRHKNLKMIPSKAAKVTDSEWEDIKELMTDPDEFTRDDIKVYHPLIAYNLVDRDVERFTKSVLNGFVKTFPDKAILMGHEQRLPGIGRIFSAKLEKKTPEEVKEIAKDMPQKFIDYIPEIVEKDGGVYFVRIGFYVLADNVEFIRSLDAGITKDMSIGFSATGFDNVTDDNGDTKYWEYKGTGEALEASFVWLGAQYGAQNQKTTKKTPLDKPEQSDDNPPDGEDPKTHVAPDNLNNGGTMKFKSKLLDLDLEYTEESQDGLVKSVEDKFQTALNTIDDFKDQQRQDQEALEQASKILEVLPEGVTQEDVKSIIERAESHKNDLVEEAIKFGAIIGLIKEDDVETKRKSFSELEFDVLQEKVTEYKTIHDEKFTGKEVLEDNPDEEEKKEFDPTPPSAFVLD